jgi:hypothetical protein
MTQWILELHDWRKSKPDDDYEVIACFLFTLLSMSELQSGVKPDHTKTFWTEVKLSRDLARRGRWASLMKDQKLKAMYQFAVEKIVEAGRKLREAPMFWTPTSPLKDGPPWDLESIKFPRPDPVVFEIVADPASPKFQTRKAAGLA